MKTKFKFFAFIFLVAGAMFMTSHALAQHTYTTSCSSPDLFESQSGTVSLMTGTGTCPTSALTAFGINTLSPAYMLDVNGDIDVSLAAGNAGYRIDGNYVLYTGQPTIYNLIVGMGAGIPSSGTYNTFVGTNTAGAGPTTGSYNTALGMEALYSVTSQSGNTAVGDSALYGAASSFSGDAGNIGIGNSALFANQPAVGGVGIDNTAIGEWALRHNTTGYNNTATGWGAQYTTGQGHDNTSDGYQALYKNTGAYNSAVGSQALNLNTSGKVNTAMGNNALAANTTASGGTAIGNYAGAYSTGSFNTFLGDSAGYNNTTGTYNTFVGYQAGSTAAAATYTNTTCLGYQAETYTTSANNTINLGNGSITNICAAGAYGITAYSDRRIKNNIKENIPGLAFISKLHPVTYNIDLHKENDLLGVKSDGDWAGKYDIEKITQSGFIAQQVDSAAQACGYDFNGVKKPQRSDGLYALNYTAFVIPLVKAVQELSAKNDSLTNVVQTMQTCLNQICGATGENNNTNGAPTSVQTIALSSTTTPLLYQNTPNPFNSGTKINYYLPEGMMGAAIVFYDNYGNQIKTIPLSQTGTGTLNITSDNLGNGIYSYSLMVNGNIIDTKRMVLER